MKVFFTVKYSCEGNEGYQGRFNVSNDYLDISVDNYDLSEAIRLFLAKFDEKYNYWNMIYYDDLNKKAIVRKDKFKEYILAYKNYCKKFN